MPLVSVILPNYNHAPYLKARIDSILNQTFDDFELIILDDASTDQSHEIIQGVAANPKVQATVLNAENSGSTFKQWQKGIAMAKGKFIWIAESDDLADSTFLGRHIDNFTKHPELGISFCASSWIDEKGKIIHQPSHEKPFLVKGEKLLGNELAKGTFIYNASSCVFRKELVEPEILAKASTYKYCGDWSFWVHLAQKTYVSRIGDRLNFFRRHSANVSFAAEADGLQFTEGFEILDELFAIKHFSHFEKIKILLYWIRRVKRSTLAQKKELLAKLPFPAKYLLPLYPIL
ncbi:glycosyltransferase family 2 protein [Marinilongibacter aquaticus]|uniref:glycosyltransferase family 2 protein n=1 Tax=Marinilongibacter aquaticus TaxID=2975157 RepID=UPI0021BDD5A2|nr:glycosyltransferase family 2 protein [Marinilongibacter aquaticus]UBM57908.1 glycosyltransferase family 2 protein [Marinilongibacter aquaticus]